MLKEKQRRKMSGPKERLILPFIEKYKDKITHIPKEGPINTIITDSHSLNQSKTFSKRTLDKENCPNPLNAKHHTLKSCDLKKGKERPMHTQQKQDALCIKLNSTGFHNMMRTLQLPSIHTKGKEQCRYMKIVLQD